MPRMKRRNLVATAIVAMSAFLAVAGATAMADGPGKDSAAVSGASLTNKPGAGSLGRAPTVTPASAAVPARCNLRCVKRSLVKLTRVHNRLARDFVKLRNDYYGCEKTTNVTQYPGYDYQGIIGATTALDFTEPGGSVSTRMVTYVC